MKAHIVTLSGDGVGPEVTAAAVAVLKTVAARYEHVFTFDEQLIGGAAIDATGAPLPAVSLAACKRADAVLLGAVGGPKWSDPNASVRPEQGLLALRAALGVYANLRPLQVHPALADLSPLKNEKLENVDVLFVRELTGGAYFGAKNPHDRYRYRRMQVHRGRSRTRHASRLRTRARSPPACHLGGQGQCAGNLAPVAQHRYAHRGGLSGRQAGTSAGRFDGDAAADAAVAL